MAFLNPDNVTNINGVIVKEFELTKHNPNKIAMPHGERKKTVAITIHNTEAIIPAAGTTMAEQYTRATYYGNMKDVRVQFYVDDKEAWLCMPLNYVNWSCADKCFNDDGTLKENSGNNTSIAIEVIGNSTKAEDNAARLAAYYIKEYNLTVDEGLRTHTYWLNVLHGKSGSIDQLNVMWNSYKNCPIYIIPHWSSFKSKVKDYYNALVKPTIPTTPSTPTVKPTTPTTSTQLYRVRKSWNDIASQLGAYSNLENAKSACKEGYSVFDSSGKSVYTKQKPVAVSTNITVAEIKNLQTMLNSVLILRGQTLLIVDGIVGPKTLNVVKQYTIESSDRGNLIGWVQNRLNKLGYYTGAIDSFAGVKTMEAIYAWQKAHGLGQGYLGGSDWNVLLEYKG